MNTTTLLAILASILIRTPRRVPPLAEPYDSYDWVAGEIRPGDPGWAPRPSALLGATGR